MNENVKFPGEQCIGCGIDADLHPMVAVLSDDGGKTFRAAPVCASCHQDPAHRRVPIKATFFERHQAADAIRLAGERDKAGNPVPTPAAK